METTEIRVTATHELSPGRPVFRNRKEYRRYRVAMKRASAKIDAAIMRAMFGDIPRQPPVYPPPHERRLTPFQILQMVP